jgi:hypothetical protein
MGNCPKTDKSVVGSRWIYKVKQGVDGSVEKYKARFVGPRLLIDRGDRL